MERDRHMTKKSKCVVLFIKKRIGDFRSYNNNNIMNARPNEIISKVNTSYISRKVDMLSRLWVKKKNENPTTVDKTKHALYWDGDSARQA